MARLITNNKKHDCISPRHRRNFPGEFASEGLRRAGYSAANKEGR